MHQRELISRVLLETAQAFGYELETVWGKPQKRYPELTIVRFAAVFVAHHRVSTSWSLLGRLLGHDRATLVYGYRRALALGAEDPAYAQRVLGLACPFLSTEEWVARLAPPPVPRLRVVVG